MASTLRHRSACNVSETSSVLHSILPKLSVDSGSNSHLPTTHQAYAVSDSDPHRSSKQDPSATIPKHDVSLTPPPDGEELLSLPLKQQGLSPVDSRLRGSVHSHSQESGSPFSLPDSYDSSPFDQEIHHFPPSYPKPYGKPSAGMERRETSSDRFEALADVNAQFGRQGCLASLSERQGSHSKEQGSHSQEHASHSQEQGSHSEEHACHSKEHASHSKEHASHSEEHEIPHCHTKEHEVCQSHSKEHASPLAHSAAQPFTPPHVKQRGPLAPHTKEHDAPLTQSTHSSPSERPLVSSPARVKEHGASLSHGAPPSHPNKAAIKGVSSFTKSIQLFASSHQGLLSGAAYCATSISMTLLNKVIISSHNFNHPTTLVCFQCCVAMALVMLCQRVGITKRARVTPSLVLTWLPISLLFVGMIWTGTLVIKHLNVPTMSVLKNINNFLIIVGEYALYRKVYRSTVWVTLFLIFLSAYCSAVTDLTFNWQGLVWQLLNSFFTAAYTLALRSQYALLQKKLDDNLDTCTHLLLKTINAVPLLLTVALLNGELATVSADPALTQPGFWRTAVTAAVGSFLISMCATWFMTNTSATTFGIVSALAKIPTVVVSVLFMGAATSAKNLLSVGLGILAGALFTWEKQQGKS